MLLRLSSFFTSSKPTQNSDTGGNGIQSLIIGTCVNDPPLILKTFFLRLSWFCSHPCFNTSLLHIISKIPSFTNVAYLWSTAPLLSTHSSRIQHLVSFSDLTYRKIASTAVRGDAAAVADGYEVERLDGRIQAATRSSGHPIRQEVTGVMYHFFHAK